MCNLVRVAVLLAGVTIFGVGSIPAALMGVPQPGIILAVRDISTPGAPSVLQTGGLADGVLAFVDRPTQTWATVPPGLTGADYIRSAQDNADWTDATPLGTLQIEVDVVDGTILHMFIDQQLTIPFAWMDLATFGSDWTDSGEDVIGAGFGGGGGTNITFDIWSTAPLAAGTYVFQRQPADASFYGIAATSVSAVPEPASFLLLGIGLGWIAYRRRSAS